MTKNALTCQASTRQMKTQTTATPNPLVSIIIPTYNSAHFLPECLNSALLQSYDNIEIIVIDDGSTDNTPDVIQPFTEHIIYRKQENRGLAGARNAGLTASTGEFIAWLDADDIAHPDRILLQANYLFNNPDAVLISSDFSAFDSKGQIAHSHISAYYGTVQKAGNISRIYPDHKEVTLGLLPGRELVDAQTQKLQIYSGEAHPALILGNFIHPPTVKLRKSACLIAGKLDETIPTAEDWDYFIRLSKIGPVAFIDYPLLQYRISEQQMSSPNNNPERIVTNIIRVTEKHLKEEPEIILKSKRELHRSLSAFHSSAAYVFSKTKPLCALAHLLKSLKYDYRETRLLKLISKIILPNIVLKTYRKFKPK